MKYKEIKHTNKTKTNKLLDSTEMVIRAGSGTGIGREYCLGGWGQKNRWLTIAEVGKLYT